MKKLPGLRAEKRRLLRVRDAALTPLRRMEIGAAQSAAARTFFMAGMAARGFSRSEALRAWRSQVELGGGTMTRKSCSRYKPGAWTRRC